MSNAKEQYSWSKNREDYEGWYATREEAAADVFECCDDADVIWTGKCVEPRQPEDYWEAEDWVDHVLCQDDYFGDYVSWGDVSNELLDELTESVRKVMADWMDKHRLRPTHFIIEEVVEHRREEPTDA